MPNLSTKLLDMLNVGNAERDFAALTVEQLSNHAIDEPKGVFPRLESK